jgi:hypothetical protein
MTRLSWKRPEIGPLVVAAFGLRCKAVPVP